MNFKLPQSWTGDIEVVPIVYRDGVTGREDSMTIERAGPTTQPEGYQLHARQAAANGGESVHVFLTTVDTADEAAALKGQVLESFTHRGGPAQQHEQN